MKEKEEKEKKTCGLIMEEAKGEKIMRECRAGKERLECKKRLWKKGRGRGGEGIKQMKKANKRMTGIR